MKKIILLIYFLTTGLNLFSQSTGLQFDGVNDIATIPHHAAYDIGQGDFTFEAWINASSTQTGIPIIFGNRSSLLSGFLMMLYNGVFAVQLGSFNVLTDSNYLYDNTCHHVACTRLGGLLTFYLDGLVLPLDPLYGNNAPYPITDNHEIWIGFDEPNPSTEFNGVIQEIRIWNIARTQAQIQASMNYYLSGTEPGLVGYWKMNEGAGQVINDFSPNQNNGVLGYTSGIEVSDPVFVNGCALLTGTSNLQGADRIIDLYPNPFSVLLTIDFKDEITHHFVTVTDILGRTVFVLNQEITSPVKSIQIQTEPFQKGIYFVAIDGKYFLKAVKE